MTIPKVIRLRNLQGQFQPPDLDTPYIDRLRTSVDTPAKAGGDGCQGRFGSGSSVASLLQA